MEELKLVVSDFIKDQQNQPINKNAINQLHQLDINQMKI